MKTKPLPSAHLEKSPLSKHFHFQSCSWLFAGLVKSLCFRTNSIQGRVPGTGARHTESTVVGKNVRVEKKHTPRMSTGYLRVTVLPSCEPKMHSCSLQLLYPLGGKQESIGRAGYPFPALCILNPQLPAGASLLIRCSRVPGSANPPYPSQRAWVLANCVLQILRVYITNAPDLRTRSKSDARGGEREGYDRTVRHPSW